MHPSWEGQVLISCNNRDSDFAEVKGSHCTSHPLLSITHGPGIRLVNQIFSVESEVTYKAQGARCFLGLGTWEMPQLSASL